jgi:hypothetical protein
MRIGSVVRQEMVTGWPAVRRPLPVTRAIRIDDPDARNVAVVAVAKKLGVEGPMEEQIIVGNHDVLES